MLGFSHVEADPATLAALQLPPGSRVYHLIRLRKADGKPIAILENWLRDNIIAINEDILTAHGLYALLRDGGVNLRVASQRVGAMVATGAQAQLLETTIGAALLTADRTALDDSGLAVETGHHVYRADSCTFEMMLMQSAGTERQHSVPPISQTCG